MTIALYESGAVVLDNSHLQEACHRKEPFLPQKGLGSQPVAALRARAGKPNN